MQHYLETGLLAKLRDLLVIKPALNDVTFYVGPEKTEVRALKILLIAASPAFETKLEPNWDTARENVDILLPNFDVEAFELFIKLTLLDSWSKDALSELNWQPKQWLNLFSICQYFEMRLALKKVEDILRPILCSFHRWNPERIVSLSHENLLTVLKSDLIHGDEFSLFECAYRWAKNQCDIKTIQADGDNIRSVLGTILFEIRFPLMKIIDFRESVDSKKILTGDETLSIYRFLCQSDTTTNPVVVEGFSTVPRKWPFLILDLTKNFEVRREPSVVCSGSYRNLNFKNQEKILLHGLGFLGPVDADASYEVSVRIFDSLKGLYLQDEITKFIAAQKETVFYYFLDKPICLDGRLLKGRNSKQVQIHHRLKGPNIKAVERSASPKHRQEEQGCSFWMEWNESQIAEILFTKIDE